MNTHNHCFMGGSFQQLTTFLKLRYDAYQEHLGLNEADVDLLDEEDAEKLGPADGRKVQE